MDVETGVFHSVIPRLSDLLRERLPKTILIYILAIKSELSMVSAILEDQRQQGEDDQQFKHEVKKLSFDIEIFIDKFQPIPTLEGFKGCGFLKNFLRKVKAHRPILASEIKRIKAELERILKLYEESPRPDSIDRPAALQDQYPQVKDLYPEVKDLVGIHGKTDQELMKLLSDRDNVPNKKLKVVSVVGFAGLGKTTLVKTVYDKIESGFDCRAFVSAGQNADVEKVLMDIIAQLTMDSSYSNTCIPRIQPLIQKLQKILEHKRYLIVIDDIWYGQSWRSIKCAFSRENNLGSRIIITTRIVRVCHVCCAYTNDSVYQMEPLSADDSRILLYDRMFGSMICPREFEEVSSDILKKCGGVPLAIIAMASVLAGDSLTMKPKDGWHVLLKSIGRELTNECWENMQIILSFSYYDLPSHLKTCLLYLSTFLGGQSIESNRLMKKWIAEEIVTTKFDTYDRSLGVEVASNFLDELINRNVIHPLECNNNGEVITCHMHPMMHDFLKAIATKKKFAASLDDQDISNAHLMNFPSLISIDCSHSEIPVDLSSPDSGEVGCSVRSLTVFGHANRILLRHFKDIRVLDLEGCKSIERADLEYICSMVQLRQLCLAKTPITELPPDISNLQLLEGLDVGGTQITQLPTEIGKLQHLKTLDARKTRVQEIPAQVLRLTGLVHLLIGDNESCEGVQLPDEIWKMASLQQLCTIDLRKCSAFSLEKLAHLPHLKNIAVVESDDPEDSRINNALFCLLNKFISKRSMVTCSVQWSSQNKYLNYWKKHTVLRSLKVPIDLAGQHLGILDIRVCKLEEDDVKILGELPGLQSLIMRLEVLPTKMIHISSVGFAKLERFYVDCRMPMVIFEEGAMPKLEQLELKLYAGSASEDHMGIKHLLNLRKVTLRYSKWYATNKGVEETTNGVKIEDREHQNKGVEQTTDVAKTGAKEHQKKGIKETIDAVRTEAKEHQNKITLCIAEEGKAGKCTMRTEIFQENKDASYSKMTEIEEDGHADRTAYFLNGGDNTQEGDLHQSSRDVAGCSTASEIEEVVA